MSTTGDGRRRPLTREEVSAFDLRNIAYHEAGHAVVARYYGVAAEPAVWPNYGRPGYQLSEESMWLGNTSFLSPATDEQKMIIGLAGEIAELLLDAPDQTPEGINEHFELAAHGISETDRAAFDGCAWADIDRALELVRSLWEKIEAEAAKLVERGRSFRSP